MSYTLRFLVLTLILLRTTSLQAQESTLVEPKTLQVLQQEDFTFVDGEGYSIVVYEMRKAYSPKTVKKLKKKFGIKKTAIGTTVSHLQAEHLVFQRIEKQGGQSLFSKQVIFASSSSTTTLVELSTSIDRDTLFENNILKLIVADAIPREVYNNMVVDSVRFVDRHIVLGGACQWQNVGSIQCPYNGQIDWSVFSDKGRAQQYLRQRVQLTADQKMSDFIAQDSVEVIFEGVETVAQRNILKIKAPKLLMGGSNELTIYYVIAKVSDLYVACVMSHYSNDNNAPDIPPLLAEVMKLRE